MSTNVEGQIKLTGSGRVDGLEGDERVVASVCIEGGDSENGAVGLACVQYGHVVVGLSKRRSVVIHVQQSHRHLTVS